MPLRFHLPSLAETNVNRPRLKYAPEAEESGAPVDAAWAVCAEFEPLLRGLIFAGYELQSIEIGIGAANGSAPAVWAIVDLPTMLIQAATAAGRSWPGQARLVVRVLVRERASLTRQSFAVSLGLNGGALGGSGAEASGALEYSTTHPAADYAQLAGALAAINIDADVATIANRLAQRWDDPSGADGLNPLTFSEAPGLLWLFYPQYWYRQPSESPTSQFLHDETLRLAEKISADRIAFFQQQIGRFANDPESAHANVQGVSKRLTGGYAHLYFRALSALNAEQGEPIGADSFYNLAGPDELGFESRVRYCEVLLHIVEAGLFPFPALVTAEHPSHYDSPDPLEVSLVMLGDIETGDELGVELRVFESEPLTMLRTVDIGYPMRRCLSWEYREPNESGMSQLIVIACPGVSISGMEQIEALTNCELRVYRVQDPLLIPAWGEKIQEFFLWMPHDHGNLKFGERGPEELPEDAAEEDAVEAYGEPAFRVQPQPLGVRILYPATASEENAKLIVDLTVDAGSDRQRFCYDFLPSEDQRSGLLQKYLLQAWATEGVSIKVVHDLPILEGRPVDELFQRVREPEGVSPFFNGRTLREMPPPGVPLPALGAPSRLRPLALAPGDVEFDRNLLPDLAYWRSWVVFLAPIAADVGIGMIPIIGDATDIAEFAASFVTGTDKWGEPVTNLDRALMLGGMALPFVSSGALRAVARTRGAL